MNDISTDGTNPDPNNDDDPEEEAYSIISVSYSTIPKVGGTHQYYIN
ncbi:MAG: hypothetical protein H6765_03390 [Candidatus Peribacteria bacterium]|nr:MAG: hypothetical protein H6765_03390 [Candidatus Peribacteria bacterium]